MLHFLHMQKWLFGVIGLILLVGLGWIAYAFFSSTPPAATQTTPNNQVSTSFPVATPILPTQVKQDPQAFTEAFYVWYLQSFAADSFFPNPENRNVTLAPWLTPQFIANWDEIQAQIEMNPVLLTDGEVTGWDSGIAASTITNEATKSSIRIVLGSGKQILVVGLVKGTDNLWKIDSVATGN